MILILSKVFHNYTSEHAFFARYKLCKHLILDHSSVARLLFVEIARNLDNYVTMPLFE